MVFSSRGLSPWFVARGRVCENAADLPGASAFPIHSSIHESIHPATRLGPTPNKVKQGETSSIKVNQGQSRSDNPERGGGTQLSTTGERNPTNPDFCVPLSKFPLFPPASGQIWPWKMTRREKSPCTGKRCDRSRNQLAASGIAHFFNRKFLQFGRGVWIMGAGGRKLGVPLLGQKRFLTTKFRFYMSGLSLAVMGPPPNRWSCFMFGTRRDRKPRSSSSCCSFPPSRSGG